MPHDYRPQNQRPYGRPQSPYRGEQDDRERGPMRRGEDRDRYAVGDERRYISDRDDRSGWRSFEGERSYRTSGYPEEFGYRRESRRDEGRSDEALRRQFRDQRSSYGEFSRMWKSDDEQGPDYYGTGSHYGGGYGTAPSSRTSAAGSWGAPGYAGQGAWSEDEDWMPENERSTSGGYENYGRSTYGAQSGYGRAYGEPLSTSQQSYRGRGPKGYERSDERLKEMICERLTDDPRIDASDVSIEVNQRLVKLTGTVPERRTKYEIEDLIERCGGVKDIDNQLRVQANEPWRGTTSPAATTGVAASAKGTEAKGPEGRSTSATKRG